MGATTPSERKEINARPPDHTERKNVPNQVLAKVVSSPSEISAWERPSPIILLSQGWLGSLASVCRRLTYAGRLSINEESSWTTTGTVKKSRTAAAIMNAAIMTSV